MLLAASVTSFAQSDMGLSDNQRVLGHTANNDIENKDVGFGQAGTYQVGALLDASALSKMVGCRVVGMRLAVSADLGRVPVYLHSVAADGTVTQIHTQRQKLTSGWNNVIFNGDGFEIKDGESLLYTFDYEETAEMVSAGKGGLCSIGSDTANAMVMLSDGKIYQLSGAGMICMQLIVDVTNMRAYDTAFGFFDTGFKYKKLDDAFEVFTMISSVGREPISSLRVGYQFDDLEPAYVDCQDAAIAFGESYTFQHTLTVPAGIGIGTHTMRLFVDRINGAPVEPSATMSRSENFAFYDNTDVKRRAVLVDVMTSSSMAITDKLNQALNTLGNINGTAIFAQHHAKGTPLYADGNDVLFSRYAFEVPVFTSNRAFFPGEKTIAYSAGELLSYPIPGITESLLQEIVAQDLTLPSFVDISAKSAYNSDSRELTVDLSAVYDDNAEAIYGNRVAAHVMLIEDNVISPQTVYFNSTHTMVKSKYTHNNVVRWMNGNAFGTPIDVNAKTGTARVTTTLDPSWNPDNMRVVAFLTKYTDEDVPDDLKDLDVYNAIVVPLSSTSGIESAVTDDADAPVEYYNLQGVRIEHPASGSIVIRRQGTKVTKVLMP